MNGVYMRRATSYTGNLKDIDGEEDGEMTSGFMQEQHGPVLQEIEMNGVYLRVTSYTGKGKEVDREEDGEMTSGNMQEQHGPELQAIEMNCIMRTCYILHWMNTA